MGPSSVVTSSTGASFEVLAKQLDFSDELVGAHALMGSPVK